MTRPDLTLRVLDIPGLVRRCVPVYESGVSGIEGCRGLLAPRVSNSTECVVRWEDRAAGMETGITGGTAVDMSHPFGRYHALLWLRERGHDLRWAEDEADVLAWSVLSVARGGGPLIGIDETAWRPTRDGEHVRGGSGRSPLRIVGPDGWRFFGSMNPLERHTLSGPETGDLGRAAADRAALAARYALRNRDGSLTLPELSKVSP